MVVGVMHVDLLVSESGSLKRKRQVLNSLKDTIRRKFQVAIAEVGGHDLWQRGALGIAVVSTAQAHATSVLNKVLDLLETDGRIQVLDHVMEML
jgi:uncharacterized protein YlxP (DUF503 family)